MGNRQKLFPYCFTLTAMRVQNVYNLFTFALKLAKSTIKQNHGTLPLFHAHGMHLRSEILLIMQQTKARIQSCSLRSLQWSVKSLLKFFTKAMNISHHTATLMSRSVKKKREFDNSIMKWIKQVIEREIPEREK